MYRKIKLFGFIPWFKRVSFDEVKEWVRFKTILNAYDRSHLSDLEIEEIKAGGVGTFKVYGKED